MNELADATLHAVLDDSGTAYLARARGLIPLLCGQADRIDERNELTPKVVDAMQDAGLFKWLLPRAYDHLALRSIEFIQFVKAIACQSRASKSCDSG